MNTHMFAILRHLKDIDITLYNGRALPFNREFFVYLLVLNKEISKFYFLSVLKVFSKILKHTPIVAHDYVKKWKNNAWLA